MPSLPPVQKFVSNTGIRIYRIPCQVFESLTARVYLLLGTDTPTLVDSGSGLGMSTRHILAGVDAVRRTFGERMHAHDIGRIIVTHSHVDHIGGLSELVEATRAGWPSMRWTPRLSRRIASIRCWETSGWANSSREPALIRPAAPSCSQHRISAANPWTAFPWGGF